MNRVFAPLHFRRWSPIVLSAMTAASLAVGSMLPAKALPLGELLFRGIQVMQFSTLSDRQEVEIGNQMHRSLASRGMRLHTGAAVNNYVNQIGQRLATASRRPQVPYQFYVVHDSRVNAFATMGGKVYVNTGLMQAADNEAQLASVISHEIGHNDERHLVNQLRKRMIAEGLVVAATGSSRNQIANLGVDLLVNRPQSRDHEYDADKVGLRILRQAGYATSAMPEFMKKLLDTNRRITLFDTHPAVPARIQALNQAIRSGPKNQCDRLPDLPDCGLDHQAYRQFLRNAL